MRNGKKVIVIKIGSSTLVNEQGKLDRAYFDGLAAQVHALRQMGWSPLIVSSAAIACGLEALGIEERPTDMPSLQAAASVGQNALMATYAEAFSRYDVLTSCVLITRHSTAQRNAYLHARDTLERLIDFDVVPIINENDTVSVEPDSLWRPTTHLPPSSLAWCRPICALSFPISKACIPPIPLSIQRLRLSPSLSASPLN